MDACKIQSGMEAKDYLSLRKCKQVPAVHSPVVALSQMYKYMWMDIGSCYSAKTLGQAMEI